MIIRIRITTMLTRHGAQFFIKCIGVSEGGGGAKHKTKQTHHHFANLQNPNPQVGLGDDCSALYRKLLFFLIYRINLYMLLKKWGGGGSSFNFNFLICKFTNEKVAGRGEGQVLCPPPLYPATMLRACLVLTLYIYVNLLLLDW